MSEFREVFREVCERYGIVQDDIAERSGISHTRVSRTVTGKVKMTKKMLCSIVVALKDFGVRDLDVAMIEHFGAKRILSDLGLADIVKLRSDSVRDWLKKEKCYGDAPTGIQLSAIRRQIRARKKRREFKERVNAQ